MSSHAASISAWCAVLLCPSMVAPLMMGRYSWREQLGGAQEHGRARRLGQRRPVAGCARTAASMADCTSAGPAMWNRASTCSCAWGMTALPVLPYAPPCRR